ncbi:MAG: LVIVD repeat-containing protein [Actinomycetota bacterium]
MRRATILLGVMALFGALVPSGALAHPGQHGPTDGHLLGTGAFGNIELLATEEVTETADLVADVTVNTARTHAFVANWSGADCPLNSESGGPDAGAWVIDITDLKNPETVGFIPHRQDSRPGEGMQVLDMSTRFFTGDVLVMNNEQCGKNGRGGVTLIDVTDPLKPVKLARNVGDRGFADVNDIHSAFAWDAGDRAYVVMVDNFEFPDTDIMDITNPMRPRLIAEYDLNDHDVDQPELQLTNSFLHDMVVKEIGGKFILLASYWDGGFVKVDVTDPANAVFIADTDYNNPDPELFESTGASLTPEGNGHEAEFTIDNQYFIGTDEDFDPYRSTKFKITTGANAGNEYDTAPTGGGAAVTFLPDHALNGPVVYGGYGCPVGSAPIPPADSIAWPTLAPGEEKIVVLQRGPAGDPAATEEACFPGEKAENGHEAGYDAVVLVARHLGETTETLPPFCGSGAFPAHEPIVTVCTTHTAMHHMFNTTPSFELPYDHSDSPDNEPAIGTLGERVEVGSIFDGWGYVHLYDANTMAELDTFAIPEAHDEDFAFGFGDLTVHEVAVDPDDADRAYLSYYSGGIRALQIVNGELVETGGYLDPFGNDFWGVETFVDPATGDTIILGSDRDSGLWIFRQTEGGE